MKTHAKDYLKEFASSQEGWMKKLIQEVIDTNGNISQERLDKIFDSYINENSLPETVSTLSATNVPKQKILLQSNSRKRKHGKRIRCRLCFLGKSVCGKDIF